MSSNDAKELEHQRIFLSNVVVSRKRNLIWGRRWRPVDIKMASGMFFLHVLALFAPSTFSWSVFWSAFLVYVFTGMLGISICYHRLLAHHSLKLPKWMEYTCAYLGVHALQRDPIYWVSIHRYHHQYVDTEKDPHSPTYGFWFSHMGWLFDSGYIMEKERNNVEDLKSQAFYRFIKRTYMWHIFGFGALVYAWGGFPYFVWIMGVRMSCFHHITFFVNSVCHIWGKRAWNTDDLSRNNWWVAMVTFGEGWHNNHHAFEYSARHGLEWWQIDFSWYLISFLKSVGLATNVKLPTQAHKLKKSFASDCKFK
ncbi:putative acyl-CoA desaturase [Helianthus annuus]|uniref:Acyl-CoA desaturase n=1 Tax=Helianthus annuus TaxID=4232 RepID=A0A251TKZ5_HELAN|nr:putative acyl-CoA desaturase [Helianthus annuus]KAJ0514414.1 putative fatty acid desaturase domain, acyl-CoA desaturase [Helianthus annuus]KAJ0522589.1 putative fatty acid desaturase domain, acyl-CoA desaturase [Helianthus annuus]KAJ0530560.1 putative fatty acid desaturase domain, acyl-CoA desaturase [Helianthus annuus]KAJ0697411.1 putative fatty acid desaturase domain, acyl-CoA desaturase [Helianthus annuus]